MSPRTEQQYEEIREEKKKLIMDTALQLFANEGYHNTSIDQIARTAGISKGLIYNYFTSKEQLLQSLIFSGFDEFAQFFDPNRDGVIEKEELHYLLREMFKLLKEKMSVWKLYFGIMLQPQVMKMVEKEVYQYALPYLKLLVDYFKKEGKENPYLEARFLSAVGDGIGMHYITDPDNFPLEECVEKLIALYQ
ncbi:MAG: TetR family transcriptional regulator [Bacteroidetes bacterium]|jgi:AcrR family transcriptional regulator|nr:TetR family transcriptional regulator [Bacteroidota bacterium]